MWQLISGVFLGWALGTNDAANVFGTAVGSRMVKFWTAAILCSVFVLLGAIMQGEAGIRTYQAMSQVPDMNTAFLVCFSAGLTVSLMTYFKLPVSTSHSVVGALILVGIFNGRLELAPLGKIIVCWISAPLGAMVVSFTLYFVLGKTLNRLNLTLFEYDRYIRIGLVVAGSYGAYALGANHVANVTGSFVGPGMLTPLQAAIIGACSIALGVTTNSRKVMMTVGKSLLKLDGFSALTVVLSEAITVHTFAEIGVPVSTSQAVVGAVLGIGLVTGMRTVNLATFGRIIFAWIGTPLVSAALTALFYGAYKLLG